MNLIERNPQSLTTQLDSAARMLNKPRAPRSIHASSYFECGLKQWYGLTGQSVTDNTFEPEYEISASVGNTIHEIIQKRLIAASIAFMIPSFDDNPGVRHLQRISGTLSPAVEVPLDERVLPVDVAEQVKANRVGGRIDAVITTKTGEVLIFEIKTIAAKYLENPSYANYFNEKLAHYEMQTQLYMHYYRTPEGTKLDRALVYVVNQSNPKDVRLYSVEYNPALMETEVARIAALAKALETKTPPDPEPHRGPCKFCAWRSACPITSKEKSNGGYLFAK